MQTIEQKDKYNQRLKLVVEQRNGQPANLDRYLHGLLKTQSLEAWNGNTDELAQWAAGCVRDYVANLEFKIWGYSADVPVAQGAGIDWVAQGRHTCRAGL